MIDSAELIIYSDTENTFSLPLSPMQLKAVIRILGLEWHDDNLNMFSDSGIQTILSKTLDRLREEK